MLRCRRMAGLVAVVAILGGCERAHRYPLATSTETSKPAPLVKSPLLFPHDGWLEPAPRFDVPLQFIAQSTNPNAWKALDDFWTGWSGPAALGLPPLEAVIALRTQLQVETIKIKVPLGLPDPTPLIPAANPPTLSKWILGKRLFFDDSLLEMSPSVSRSCAGCHRPAEAFALNSDKPKSGKRNVPSLLNSVYNRHQFWDGRVDALEQVLLGQLEDQTEADGEPSVDQSPGYLHAWPGVVKRVGGKPHYLYAFKLVFGTDPTADNIAKALATYLRTLLSGNSLVDRAADHLKERRGEALEQQDFAPFLSGEALKRLPSELSPQEAAKELARGSELFHGKARCSLCHAGPLFTDHGFHNIGIAESANFPLPGKEPGRFAFVPFGLKDRRLIGAFKTPSLRDVSRTAPYMHDGSIATLADVLKYFNADITAELNAYLDPELTTPSGLERKLHLGARDLAAMELFLRALQGETLPSLSTEPALK